MKIILGKKIGITRIFDKKSNVLPVTVVKAGPCLVSQVKNQEKDQYRSVQIAFGESKYLNKPVKGHLKKINEKNFRYLKEFKISKDETEKYKPGQEINLDIFKNNEKIDVVGVSKGKGFAGTVKRHNFTTGPKTHGSNNYRQPGSIGATYPQRTIKGKKMSGHMGNVKTTMKNLEIIDIIKEENLMLIKGSVPGTINSLLIIKGK